MRPFWLRWQFYGRPSLLSGLRYSDQYLSCELNKSHTYIYRVFFQTKLLGLAYILLCIKWASLGAQWRIHLQCRRPGFDPWVGKTPWRRAWQPAPALLSWRIPVDRGAWQATAHGLAKSWTRLSNSAWQSSVCEVGNWCTGQHWACSLVPWGELSGKERLRRGGICTQIANSLCCAVKDNTTLWSNCCSLAKLSLTLWPHGPQHASLPCPPLSPGVCSRMSSYTPIKTFLLKKKNTQPTKITRAIFWNGEMNWKSCIYLNPGKSEGCLQGRRETRIPSFHLGVSKIKRLSIPFFSCLTIFSD